MTRMFWINDAVESDPAIDDWLQGRQGDLQVIARHWFQTMRQQGDDVREAIHDGFPTACVGPYPFAYVAVFKAHVNVGFYLGVCLDDPSGLLEGSGKFMRHVKIVPGREPDQRALSALIDSAYQDMRERAEQAGPPGMD